MAGRTKANDVKGLAIVVLAAGLVFPAGAQTRLTLAEACARDPAAGYAPLHAGRRVSVRGIANGPAFHFPDYSLLAIEDGQYGAILKAPGSDARLDQFVPGDEVQAEGTVSSLDGMVVIEPAMVVLLDRKQAPMPADLPLDDLQGFRYLGRLVRIEGRVKAAEAAGTGVGVYVALEAPAPYRIFIPYRVLQPMGPSGFRPGDRVRATGVAYQFCPQAPFNRSYQLLAHEPAAIIHTDQTWYLSPMALAIALGVVLFIGYFLWSRERRLRGQREILRKTYELGEEILSASSAPGILKRIREALPGILGVTRARLYIYNRAPKTLETVSEEPGGSKSISLNAAPGGTHAGAVACFHYRTLLVIPDIDRSPFPIAQEGERTPRSLLFVPMLAQGEVVGVLELDQDDRVRDFSAGEQELAQHLGNQIGVAIRLLDQRSVQEQLFRTEKLAAVGRLISGVVNELQTPLSSISDLAHRALEKSSTGPAEREVRAIAAESQKAAAMVQRLVSFAAAEQVEARPVSISTLLRNLIEFRELDWKASGIRVRDLTSREPLTVLGSQGQLEQVFLNLLVHAEQSLAEAPHKVITVRTSVLAKRLLVEIAFTAPLGSSKPEETAAVLGVTRSVVAGHGGEVRLIEKNNADPRFEVELPSASKERAAAGGASNGQANDFARRMTALVIEPEESAQRQILGLLAARGFRVVPVNNSDNGLELAHRMRFDVAFCSVRAPGLNWVELSERMHSTVGAFVLLSEGYDAELAADFEGDGRFVLAKPVQEADLERLLRSLEPVSAAVRNGVA